MEISFRMAPSDNNSCARRRPENPKRRAAAPAACAVLVRAATSLRRASEREREKSMPKPGAAPANNDAEARAEESRARYAGMRDAEKLPGPQITGFYQPSSGGTSDCVPLSIWRRGEVPVFRCCFSAGWEIRSFMHYALVQRSGIYFSEAILRR